MKSTTHVTLDPDSTSPVGVVLDIPGGNIGGLLNTVQEPGLTELATAIRQNRRNEEDTGDEGGVEEHSDCEGVVLYEWSKE